MNRRALLLALPFGCAFALSGCAAGPGPSAADLATDLAAARAEAATLATGLTRLLGLVGVIDPAQSAAWLDLLANVGDVQSLANTATAWLSGPAAQTTVRRIAADVNGIVGIAALLPLPAAARAILSAAQALLPAIQAASGVPAPVAAAGAGAMTLDQARAVLRGA